METENFTIEDGQDQVMLFEGAPNAGGSQIEELLNGLENQATVPEESKDASSGESLPEAAGRESEPGESGDQEQFEYSSLEDLVSALGVESGEWEQVAGSSGGDVLNKESHEWIFRSEEGQEASITEAVKGTELEGRHTVILEQLYSKGFAVSEYDRADGEARVRELYFADAHGHISYEIYQLAKQQLESEPEPAEEPQPAALIDFYNESEPVQAELGEDPALIVQPLSEQSAEAVAVAEAFDLESGDSETDAGNEASEIAPTVFQIIEGWSETIPEFATETGTEESGSQVQKAQIQQTEAAMAAVVSGIEQATEVGVDEQTPAGETARQLPEVVEILPGETFISESADALFETSGIILESNFAQAEILTRLGVGISTEPETEIIVKKIAEKGDTQNIEQKGVVRIETGEVVEPVSAVSQAAEFGVETHAAQPQSESALETVEAPEVDIVSVPLEIPGAETVGIEEPLFETGISVWDSPESVIGSTAAAETSNEGRQFTEPVPATIKPVESIQAKVFAAEQMENTAVTEAAESLQFQEAVIDDLDLVLDTALHVEPLGVASGQKVRVEKIQESGIMMQEVEVVQVHEAQAVVFPVQEPAPWEILVENVTKESEKAVRVDEERNSEELPDLAVPAPMTLRDSAGKQPVARLDGEELIPAQTVQYQARPEVRAIPAFEAYGIDLAEEYPAQSEIAENGTVDVKSGSVRNVIQTAALTQPEPKSVLSDVNERTVALVDPQVVPVPEISISFDILGPYDQEESRPSVVKISAADTSAVTEQAAFREENKVQGVVRLREHLKPVDPVYEADDVGSTVLSGIELADSVTAEDHENLALREETLAISPAGNETVRARPAGAALPVTDEDDIAELTRQRYGVQLRMAV